MGADETVKSKAGGRLVLSCLPQPSCSLLATSKVGNLGCDQAAAPGGREMQEAGSGFDSKRLVFLIVGAGLFAHCCLLSEECFSKL